MTKIFNNYETKRRFVELYEKLAPISQTEFGEEIRRRADEKITRLDDIDDFYVTEADVEEIYEQVS